MKIQLSVLVTWYILTAIEKRSVCTCRYEAIEEKLEIGFGCICKRDIKSPGIAVLQHTVGVGFST